MNIIEQPILKSDRLVEITSKFDSIEEQRFINSCLVGIYQRKLLDPEHYYPIDIAHYADRRGVTLGKAYTELKELAKIASEKSVDIQLEGSQRWFTRVIYSYRYSDLDLTLDVKFNEELVPYLSGDMLKGTYTIYDSIMDKVPSNRRYIMAEVIQRNLWQLKKRDFFILKLSEVRKALNLADTEYKVYADLNKRIISLAVKDIAELKNIYLKVKKTKQGIIFTQVEKEDGI